MKNLSNKQLNFIVVLRVIVGWHFLYEGMAKLYTPDWTSAEFLSISGWLLAPFYHWIAETPAVLQIVDFLNIWGLILIGLALFIGLFERFAAISGIVLLTLYYFANPPFVGNDFGVVTEGNYLIVNKTLIELAALVVLLLIPTGKYIGIDKFVQRIKTPKLMPLYNKTDRGGDKYTETGPLKRRELLKGLATVPLLGVFGFALYKQKKWKSYEEQNLVDAVTSASIKNFKVTDLSELKQTIQTAKIQNKTFSRVILGGNLLSGYSHSRDLIYVSELVKRYHSRDKIFATFLLAEKCGVNTVLSHPIMATMIDEYWKRGLGKIQFISDCAGLNYDKGVYPKPFDEYLDFVKRAIDYGATACYIQGETADYYIQNNLVDRLEKVIQLIEDNHVIMGIGAHRIETIQACVEHGFDPAFWMKTLHDHNYWSAKHPEWHDNMYCFNPTKTIEYMKTLPQPWIAFKVMAAGAIHPQQAFRYAFENGADFICAGMYDFQMVEDINIATEILNSEIRRERKWLA